MRKIGSFLLIAFVMSSIGSLKLQAQKHNPDDIIGNWLNEERTAKVQVYKDGPKYFGKIIWLKEPLDNATGKPRTDNLNPDPQKQHEPLIGLNMLKNFVFDGKDEWTDGSIYDPKNGKTYKCYIKFENPQMLKIRGYIGVSVLGRTTHWFKTN